MDVLRVRSLKRDSYVRRDPIATPNSQRPRQLASIAHARLEGQEKRARASKTTRKRVPKSPKGTNPEGESGRARMNDEGRSPLIVSPHTAAFFKTVCWARGPVSSPAHVQNHEPRYGAPRRGLGRTSARAIAGYAIPHAHRSASPAG